MTAVTAVTAILATVCENHHNISTYISDGTKCHVWVLMSKKANQLTNTQVYNHFNSLDACKGVKYTGVNHADSTCNTDVWPQDTEKPVKTTWNSYPGKSQRIKTNQRRTDLIFSRSSMMECEALSMVVCWVPCEAGPYGAFHDLKY